MELCEFTGQLYDELTDNLTRIDEDDALKQNERAVIMIYDHLKTLKEFTQAYSFKTQAEEIQFFKEAKPKFTALLIYHMALYNIDLEKPLGGEKVLKGYYEKELQKLEYFFQENADFHKYYRSGACHLDEKYFIHGSYDIHLTKGAFLIDLDPAFSTLCDYKVARILANDMLVGYLSRSIEGAEVPKAIGGQSKLQLAWTASKTDFIELLYGLYCIGAFNNGSVELNKVMNSFAMTFGVEFGNYSRYFQQMRIRKKNRTRFIDKLREKLINYMDELDDRY